jgi:hypothetical protein
MHAKDDPRMMRFRDGFWFSKQVLQRESEKLDAIRITLSPDALTHVVQAVATAWQIVDVVQRVRDLAEGVPGVNKRPGSRTDAFLNATAIAEHFRHYVQHLRGEVSKPEVDRFPVWGALSWVSAADERTLHTTFLGVMQPGTEFHAGVYDALQDRWVSRVSLSVDRVHFNVDPIVAETTAFCDHILAAIAEIQPGLPPVGILHPFSTRFVVPSDGDRDAAARAIPGVFPKPLVDEVNRRATEAERAPSDLVSEAMRAWAAAGRPREDVPESVNTTCSDLSDGAALLVRDVFRAVAWWLRQPQSEATTQPTPAGEAIDATGRGK